MSILCAHSNLTQAADRVSSLAGGVSVLLKIYEVRDVSSFDSSSLGFNHAFSLCSMKIKGRLGARVKNMESSPYVELC